jgi:hypothetical protein
MSSQCTGLNIENTILIQCENMSNDNYCNEHKHKYRLEKPDDCPVCMEHISELTEIPLCCGHWVHKQCLIPNNKHICPLCRQSLTYEEINYIFENQPVHNLPEIDYSNYNNLEYFMNDFPSEFPQNDFENYQDEIPEIYEDNILENIQDEEINLIINTIETSPRNNPYVNLNSSLNFVHPNREIDFHEYIHNMIENYSAIVDEHIRIFSGDILLTIVSNSIDIKLFSVGFNICYQPINPNFYLRILRLMENRILEIYQIYHQ